MKQDSETEMLKEYSEQEYKYGFVSDIEKEKAAEMMARYSGISKKVILQYNLDVPASFFWKE